MNINQKAPLIAHKEIFIQALPEAVWRTHTDINHWNQWQPSITKSNLTGALATGSTFTWQTGGLTLTSMIQMVEPNQRIGWSGTGLGTRASHIWMMKAKDNGTQLTTEESMEGWFVRLLKLFMPNFLDKSLDTWLQSLKQRVEA